MRLLAIDGNSILNRAFYGIKLLTTKDGCYTNAIYGFLNILLKLMTETKPDAVAVSFDLPAPTFRHKRYAGYKAQRKGMPPELAQQLAPLKELLDNLGFIRVEAEGFEADDILGTLAATCTRTGDECVIATGDRDSLQLISEQVTVRLTTTRMGQAESILYDVAAFREKYGVDPIRLIDLKALMGDASDNIPGVKGIGEKGAMQLIGQFGSLEAVYEGLETADLKPAMRKKLEDGREMAYLSKELATICSTAPVPTDLEHYRRGAVHHTAAAHLLSQLEMYKMIERFGVDTSNMTEIVAPDAPARQTIAVVELEELLRSLEDAPTPTVDLLFTWEGDSPTQGILLAEGKLACTSSRTVLARVLKKPWRKRVENAKQYFRFAQQAGAAVQNMVFDTLLAGYLCNPNSTNYTLQALAQQCGAQTALLNGELPEAYAPLREDAALFSALCDKLTEEISANGQEQLLGEIEVPLAQVLASMELDGFAIDTEALARFGNELDVDLQRSQAQIYEYADGSFNINSPMQLGEILFERLGLPAKKKTKTGYSTNAEVLETLRGKHPIVDCILEYRKLSKLKSTYVDGLLRVVAEDGRIHSSFNQTETRTGRISSTEPNMQNIPVRTELGSNLRKFFEAKPGCVLVDADYSQIELRVLAHISHDANMTAAFLSGDDIHTQTASQVFGLPPAFVTPTMRSRAKAVNFGIVYGISAFSLSQDIGVTVQEADSYIKGYLTTYAGVHQYMEDTIAFAREKGYVATMWGRRRYLPELSSSNHNMRSFGERVAMNTPIQGSAADIIKIAMVRVYRRLREEGLSARLILQVHDELMVEAPEAEAEHVRSILREEMEHAAELCVPLVADAKTGRTWYEAH